jgi:hypothetical protein
MSYARQCAFTVLLSLLVPSDLNAQAKSHAYVSAGAGATDLNGGVDWVIADGPLSVGADVGVGWVFLAALNASYHPLARRTSAHDIFATVGYAGMSSSEFSSQGVTVGGGGTYWPARRVGLRFDAFKFLPVSTTNNIPAAERSRSRYWGVRAGVAFSF